MCAWSWRQTSITSVHGNLNDWNIIQRIICDWWCDNSRRRVSGQQIDERPKRSRERSHCTRIEDYLNSNGLQNVKMFSWTWLSLLSKNWRIIWVIKVNKIWNVRISLWCPPSIKEIRDDLICRLKQTQKYHSTGISWKPVGTEMYSFIQVHCLCTHGFCLASYNR